MPRRQHEEEGEEGIALAHHDHAEGDHAPTVVGHEARPWIGREEVAEVPVQGIGVAGLMPAPPFLVEVLDGPEEDVQHARNVTWGGFTQLRQRRAPRR